VMIVQCFSEVCADEGSVRASFIALAMLHSSFSPRSLISGGFWSKRPARLMRALNCSEPKKTADNFVVYIVFRSITAIIE
jgi:hypothetical protein